MRIALRVDASSQRGLGHLTRCLALGDALVELGSEVGLVFRRSDVDIRGRAASHALRHFVELPLDQAAGSDQDAVATISGLFDWKPDWVIVDDYALDAAWHRPVRDALGCRVAVVDDLADRDLDADLLVDHNLRSDAPGRYALRLRRERTRCLFGPRYALLAAAYGSAEPWREPPEPSIGVFLGGTDPGAHSVRVLEAIRGPGGFGGPVEVVTTTANPALASLRAAVQRDAQCSLTIDLPNLAGFFGRHSLHVGAGGGASWERCRLGAPTLALVLAENQRATVPMLASLGIVAALEEAGAPPSKVGSAVNALLQDPHRRFAMSEASRSLVDGFGAVRVAAALLASSMQVRRAIPDDARCLFDWRNHPATRAASRVSTPLTWESHLRWQDAVLSDPDRRLFVGQLGARPVGVVRLDLDRRCGDIEVSLYLDPMLLGLGLGPSMLAAAQRAWCVDSPGGHRFVATVLPGNVASSRLFESLGYQWSGDRYIRSLDSE